LASPGYIFSVVKKKVFDFKSPGPDLTQRRPAGNGLPAKAGTDKLQTIQNACSPVAPGMTAIPHPGFMRNLPIAHSHMKSSVAFIKKIIITAI
jgi:hypothetical protein